MNVRTVTTALLPVVLGLAALVPTPAASSSPGASRIGGLDVPFPTSGADGLLLARQMDTTINGDIYAAVRKDEPRTGAGIRILRSQDGGTNWEVWAERNAPGDTEYLFVEMHIVDGVQPKIFLAYTIREPAALDFVAVSWSVLGGTPTFLTYYPFGSDVFLSDPTITSDHDVTSTPTVHVVAWSNTEGIRHVKSTNGGFNWTPGPRLDAPGSDSRGARIDVGATGTLHLAWNDYPAVGDQIQVRYRRSTNDGATWGPEVALSTAGPGVPDDSIRDVESSKVSDATLIVADTGDYVGFGYSPTGTRVWKSSDDGLTWTPNDDLSTQRTFDVLVAPDAEEWAAFGSTAEGTFVLRTLDGLNGSWTGPARFDDPQSPGFSRFPGCLVRGTEIYRGWGMGWSANSVGAAPFFDATWRSGRPYPHLLADPVLLSSPPVSAPAVVDLESIPSDIAEEIVYANAADQIVVVDGHGVVRWSRTVNGLPPNPQVAIGDLEGNGSREVVVGDQDGLVWAFNREGLTRPGFPVDLGFGDRCYATVAPVVQGNRDAIVAVGEGTVAVIDETGSVVASWSDVAQFDIEWPASVGDVTADGSLDIVVPSSGDVSLIDVANDAVSWTRTIGATTISAPVTLVDLDRDGGPLEIVVPLSDGHILCLEAATGNTRWSKAVSQAPVSAVAVTAAPAFVALGAVSDGNAFMLREDGSDLLDWPMTATELQGGAATAPIFGILSSISPDMLFGTPYGIEARGVFTDAEIGWPAPLPVPPVVPPAIGDVDGDSFTEMVVLTADRMFVLDIDTVLELAPDTVWPMDGKDPGRSRAQIPESAVPTAVETPGPRRVAFDAPTPNPFNPSTTLRYVLADRGHVNLDVFDTRGRLVSTLVDEVRDAGAHQLQWTAEDGRGAALASGVYLAVLRTGETTATRKLTLVE